MQRGYRVHTLPSYWECLVNVCMIARTYKYRSPKLCGKINRHIIRRRLCCLPDGVNSRYSIPVVFVANLIMPLISGIIDEWWSLRKYYTGKILLWLTSFFICRKCIEVYFDCDGNLLICRIKFLIAFRGVVGNIYKSSANQFGNVTLA